MTSQEMLQQTTDTDAASSMLKAMQLGGFSSFLDSQMAQQVRASGPLSQSCWQLGQWALRCAGLQQCLAAAQDGESDLIALLLSIFHRELCSTCSA